jgi:hypothetical protein
VVAGSEIVRLDRYRIHFSKATYGTRNVEPDAVGSRSAIDYYNRFVEGRAVLLRPISYLVS